jgi:apolipoprotein N-acyltransferase
MSQVRAAENGVWVVHAALSGISAFVGPDGKVVRSAPLWKATSIVHTVRFSSSTTPYTKVGDWLPILCLVASVVLVGISVRGRKSSP